MNQLKTFNVQRTIFPNMQYAICNLQFAFLIIFGLIVPRAAPAAELTVELGNSQDVTFVGAIFRWDQDGNHRKLPDAKAKIDAPAADATARQTYGGKWIFKDLLPGKYDLVVLAKDRIRIEGFQFVPVKEFDPFVSPEAALRKQGPPALHGRR
jgi:hypothetical protein